MTSRRPLRLIAVACALSLAAGLAGAVASNPAQAVDADLACGDSLVEKTLKNGAAWRMCVRIHPIKGLVLEKIEFKPATGSYEYAGYKRVIDQLHLAQLNVAYDGGMGHYNDITSYGFGDAQLIEQVPELCAGQTRDVTQSMVYLGQLIHRTMPGICTDEVPTGASSHAKEQQIGDGLRFVEPSTAMEVSSVSKVSWYEYQQKLTFGDHGQIDVGLGATGDLAPSGGFYPPDPARGWPIGASTDTPQTYAASHRHNAIYRIDFGIDAGEQQRVEQWDYAPSSADAQVIDGTGDVKDAAFNAIPGTGNDELTWWRVLNPASLNRDGHARSYEIVNRNYSDKYSAVTEPIVSFTNDHACQEYASENLNPDCPNQSILDYVADETEPLTDPVAWVNVGFHHIVRDEDQSPMPMHWQNFQLVPRDFFAQNPSIPEARRCINGLQNSSTVSDSPCSATNQTPPQITAVPTDVTPGTRLTASTGTWNTSRTTWNYSYLWFRDGKPIVDTAENGDPAPAIESTYRVTEADQGTAVTVKVTASQTGYGSGTAESAPVLVPGGPTPTVPTPDVPPAPPVARSAQASSTSGKLVKSKLTVRQNPRLRVTVSAPGSVPSGTFQIRHGSKILKTGRLTNGRATITLPKLTKARTYRLRIVYLGSSAIKASKSGLITLRVVKR